MGNAPGTPGPRVSEARAASFHHENVGGVGPEAAQVHVDAWRPRIYGNGGLTREERKASYMEISGADHMQALYDMRHRKEGGGGKKVTSSQSHYAALLARIERHRSDDVPGVQLDVPASTGGFHGTADVLEAGHLVEVVSSKDQQLINQVDKDVYRTAESLVVEKMDADQYEVRCQQLRRVLEAYCLHNRAIGYCQSMNFVCWNILDVLDGDEEKSFWVLAALCEYHFQNYWVPSMIGMQVDMAILDHLAKKRAPQAFGALEQMGLPLQTASPQWLLSLLLGVLPSSAGQCVLDCVLLEGRPALLGCCLAFLKTLEEELVDAAQYGGDIADAMHILTEHRGHQLMAARWAAPGTIEAYLTTAATEGAFILSQEMTVELDALRQTETAKYHSVAEAVNAKLIKRDALEAGLLDEEFEFIYKIFVEKATEPWTTPDLRHLNEEQFREILASCVPRWAEDDDEVKVLFDAFDADGNGMIDVNELMAGIRFLDANCPSAMKMRFLFHLFDRDCDDHLGQDDLKAMLEHMFRHLGVKVSSEAIDAHVGLAMNHAAQQRAVATPRPGVTRSSQHNSCLDFQEFCEALQTIPLLG